MSQPPPDLVREHMSDLATWVVNTLGAAAMQMACVAFLGGLVALAAEQAVWLLVGLALGFVVATIKLLNAEAPRPSAPFHSKPSSFEDPDPR